LAFRGRMIFVTVFLTMMLCPACGAWAEEELLPAGVAQVMNTFRVRSIPLALDTEIIQKVGVPVSGPAWLASWLCP
jgi:hypothetical protein